MKLSKEVKEDAKRYNREYFMFKAVSSDGLILLYEGYGIAYRYTSARVRKGEIWTIYGMRDTGETDELITC